MSVEDTKTQKILDTGLSYLKTIVLTAATVMLMQTFLIKVVVVNGSSMYPTYVEGDYALSFIAGKENLKRFDIVCISTNENGEHNIIKRVIGLPGETVEYKGNQLYIDGNPVDEPFLGDNINTQDIVMVSGDDEIIVLGDNREHSRDSRGNGPYKLKDVISKGAIVLPKLSEMTVG